MACSNLPGKISLKLEIKIPELVLFSIKNFQFQMAANKRLLDFLHIFFSHKMVSQCLRKDLRKEIIFLDPLHSPGHIISFAREKIQISRTPLRLKLRSLHC
jgi:hypothetical protein